VLKQGGLKAPEKTLFFINEHYGFSMDIEVTLTIKASRPAAHIVPTSEY